MISDALSDGLIYGQTVAIEDPSGMSLVTGATSQQAFTVSDFVLDVANVSVPALPGVSFPKSAGVILHVIGFPRINIFSKPACSLKTVDLKCGRERVVV